MLILRSFRDYPVAFSEGKGRAFLTPKEAKEFSGLAGDPTSDSWLLSRIATKEVAQRYCDLKHSFVPEISQLQLGGISPRRLSIALNHSQAKSVPALEASFDTSDQFVVTCLRPVESGERFSVVIKRVESSYPFADFSKLDENERQQVRFAAPEEADRVLHGIYAVKQALLEVGAPVSTSLVALSLRGSCELHTRHDAKLHAGCWYFDHHVMAVGFHWEAPHTGPVPGARVEEDPVLPESRHSEMTL